MTRLLDRRTFIAGGTTLGLAGLSGCLQSTFLEGTIDPEMDMSVLPGSMFKGAPAHGEYPATPNDEGFVDVLMIAQNDDSNNYHFMPHVAWVEPGTTVRWKHTEMGSSEARTHSTSAFDGTAFIRLIPENAESWDSGFLPGSHAASHYEVLTEKVGEGPFTHTFEQQGVYLYYCQPHHEFKMAAGVVVGDLTGENRGEGWEPAMTVDLERIAEVDPIHGPALEAQTHELREMIESGGEAMGHGMDGEGGDEEHAEGERGENGTDGGDG